MSLLDGEHKIAIAVMQEDDLVDLHFSLGLAIRNAFDLHDRNSKLLADCGAAQPDDASVAIVRELYIKPTKV